MSAQAAMRRKLFLAVGKAVSVRSLRKRPSLWYFTDDYGTVILARLLRLGVTSRQAGGLVGTAKVTL
jgi:hypothetical protein